MKKSQVVAAIRECAQKIGRVPNARELESAASVRREDFAPVLPFPAAGGAGSGAGADAGADAEPQRRDAGGLGRGGAQNGTAAQHQAL